jgi:hypothetical protein
MDLKDATMDTTNAEQDLVTHVLEQDQLSQAKKRPVPRKQLRGPELLVLWSLRVYVLFMIAVVVYQVMVSMR